jgi:2-methylisocitrate lyase-like PEP mutase family enzyme
MDTTLLASRAETLAALHAAPRLVLPPVWDAWSANTAVKAGFQALTISHPLADSRGAADHEGQTFSEVSEAVRRIIASVDVPPYRLEAGYGQTPADLIAGLLDAGGVGLSIDDTVHAEGGRVGTTDEHADYVAGLRAAADCWYPRLDQRPH